MDILNIVTIADIAELLSAFAAFLTVGLAFIELSNRTQAKKAEMAMDLYSDYLYIKQCVAYAVANVHSFVVNLERHTEAELVAFVKTHTIDPSFFSIVQKLTKESVSSFDCLSTKGKDYSVIILDLSGNITNLMLFINTFFTANANGSFGDSEKIEKSYQHINSTYEKLLPSMEMAGDLLKSNLKETHQRSNLYLGFLLIAVIVLLAITIIL